MKQSEKYKDLVERIMERGLSVDARDLADFILAELKREGVKWEPEEEPLPKRLEYRIADPEVGLDVRLWPTGERMVSVPRKEKCYAEAARRYNAWEDVKSNLEKWISLYLSCPTGTARELDLKESIERIIRDNSL